MLPSGLLVTCNSKTKGRKPVQGATGRQFEQALMTEVYPPAPQSLQSPQLHCNVKELENETLYWAVVFEAVLFHALLGL